MGFLSSLGPLMRLRFLLSAGSHFGCGFLILNGSLPLNGFLSPDGSLLDDRFLPSCGSLYPFGFLLNSGSLRYYGFLNFTGSLPITWNSSMLRFTTTDWGFFLYMVHF